MLKRTVSGILLSLLLISLLASAFNVQTVEASGTIYIRPDGSVDPPDAAISTVDNVTYTFTDNIITDSVVVERSNIIIDGNGYTLQGFESGNGFHLSFINNVTIKNTNIKGFNDGIYVFRSTNSILTNNDISNNYRMGIYLGYSTNNTLTNNNASSNRYSGIYLFYSPKNILINNSVCSNRLYGINLNNYCPNNTLTNNTASFNGGFGIILSYATNSTLRNNNMSNNQYNFHVGGFPLLYYQQDIDTSNTVDGKPIYYLVNEKDKIIDASTNAGYVAAINSTNITVKDLTLTNNGEGVLFFSTSNSRVENLNVSNNKQGIYVDYSTNNIVINNTASFNDAYGINVRGANNIVANNDVSNNNYDGIRMTSSNNNILTNNTVSSSNRYGIWLRGSNNTITSNDVSNNKRGFYIDCFSTNNNIINNTASFNDEYGISLCGSNNNIINFATIGNYYGISIGGSSNNIINSNVTGNYYGIFLVDSSNSTLFGNNITNSNDYGIWLAESSNNKIYHNNFINNTEQAYIETLGYANIWDDGYPSGGNYWSNYTDIDFYRGPHQTETGSDGIWDHPYIINPDNQDHYPLRKPYTGQHDIEIMNITTSKTVVGQGFTLRINVTVLNHGIYTENFNITALANTTVINQTQITLTSRNSTTVTFTWDTTGVAYGNYTISAYAHPIPGETDTTDNTLTDGWVVVTIPGDINGNYKVDHKDLLLLASAYGSKIGDTQYIPEADINNDGKVDHKDLLILAANYGKET